VTGIEKKEEPNKQTGFWVIKTNKMHFSFFISIIYPLHVSKRVTIHHQKAVTVYAAYCIYLADNILKLCKINLMFI